MCKIPDRVQSIANAFCLTVVRRPCPELPCVLVYQFNETNKRGIYLANGRSINTNKQQKTTNSSKIQRVECIISPALELFMHGPPYPSLQTDGYINIDKKLFGDVLSEHYRSSNNIWGLSLNGESIRYYPTAGKKSILSFFDITQGYDRHLYDVITDAYPHEQKNLMQNARISYDSAVSAKQQPPTYVTAPILWMNSNCHAPSNRTQYMKELMRYIPVDSWGKCGRNKGPELPPEIVKIYGLGNNISHYKSQWVLTKKAMMKHYMFTVAFENSIEHDYITEKLWHPLAGGSVPLYYGAPNVDDWLPCKDCIINLQKFPNPKAAAEFIKSVSNNANKYAQYHKWRKQPTLPKFQKILDYFQRANAYTLDSMICAMSHSRNPQLTRYEILNDIGPMFGSDG
jgi:hypothetical protein